MVNSANKSKLEIIINSDGKQTQLKNIFKKIKNTYTMPQVVFGWELFLLCFQCWKVDGLPWPSCFCLSNLGSTNTSYLFQLVMFLI